MLTLPTLVIDTRKACLLSSDGEITTFDCNQLTDTISIDANTLVCHAPYTANKLMLKHKPAFDILELYAFVYPTQFTVPTINGLARTLGLEPQNSLEDQTMLLLEIAQYLIEHIKDDAVTSNLLNFMKHQNQGWAWSSVIFEKMGKTPEPVATKDIALWNKRPEWEEHAPPPPASQHGITVEHANENMKLWLSNRASKAEDRPQQFDYTKAITHSFQPTESENSVNITLAEAGTGIGKTLGYLNPAWLWAQKNADTVWLSTYTKNLQRRRLPTFRWST